MHGRRAVLALLTLGSLHVASGVAQDTVTAGCPERAAARRRIVTATALGGEAAAVALRQADWWPSRPRRLHFIWGGSPSAGQNDLLHAAITYQIAQVAALAWDWACVSPTRAGWLGAATAIGVGIVKETGDGFHSEGFSGSTLLWESISALVPAMHRQWPVTRIAQAKVFYWPSAEYRNGPTKPSLQNDYAGMRFFATLNPARSPGYSGAWPKWLGVAVGHGTPGWLNLTTRPQSTWYASMDIDLHAIPVHAGWWRPVTSVIDQIHIPLPGVRLTGSKVEAGLF